MLSDASSGNYTVTQLEPIDPPDVECDRRSSCRSAFGYTVTDGDGDTAPGSLSISVDDDTPTTAANAAVLLDDEAAVTTYGLPNAGGTGDLDPNPRTRRWGRSRIPTAPTVRARPC